MALYHFWLKENAILEAREKNAILCNFYNVETEIIVTENVFYLIEVLNALEYETTIA